MTEVPLPDIKAEAERVLAAAGQRGIPLRLMGGLAVARLSPSAANPPLARVYKDIDLVAPKQAARPLTALLTELGYLADEHFNALHGDKRLFFWDEANQRQLDVFVDRFEMCHSFDLRDRLALESPAATMPPADLLLMKLQVVEINQKDLQDIAALLQDHPLTPEGIDLGYITRLTGKDWGLHHTLEINIGRLREHEAELAAPGAAYGLGEQLDRLAAALESAPKSTGWKMRSRVGERMQWYELPEEEGHQV
ncbi:MAG TPA: nucleotidyltransferase family protein [Chloroflexota bacterium]|nr:nucleotidyltransferase family protein [Chloroflexota bacterium]